MPLIENILSDIARMERARMERECQLSIGLLGGDLGSILYLYEYSRLEPSYQTLSDNLLDKMLSGLRHDSYISTYCNGISGLVVGLYSLRDMGFVDDCTPLLKSIDQYISRSLDTMLETNNHDFLHGFIGLGFYWLLRFDSKYEEAVESLKKILMHLLATSEACDGVIKWPRKESKWVKRYNISLSHGYSSTIILLCRMLNIAALDSCCGLSIRELISGAVNYILSNRLDEEKYGCWFASSSLECEQPYRSRLAWCYGDLGIALALHEASLALTRPELSVLSKTILEQSGEQRRDLVQNHIFDACVCHGSAGVGIIFREMSRVFSSKKMSDAADYWREVVLRQAIQKDAGYTYLFYETADRGYTQSTSMLNGLSGVALYLLNEYKCSSLANYLLING